MAPTIMIFKDGVKETVFKAGLDLELPADLEEIQEEIVIDETIEEQIPEVPNQ